MSSLDQVANQTATIAAENRSSSVEFSERSAQLKAIFNKLNNLVNGIKTQTGSLREVPREKEKEDSSETFEDFDFDDIANGG